MKGDFGASWRRNLVLWYPELTSDLLLSAQTTCYLAGHICRTLAWHSYLETSCHHSCLGTSILPWYCSFSLFFFFAPSSGKSSLLNKQIYLNFSTVSFILSQKCRLPMSLITSSFWSSWPLSSQFISSSYYLPSFSIVLKIKGVSVWSYKSWCIQIFKSLFQVLANFSLYNVKLKLPCKSGGISGGSNFGYTQPDIVWKF